MYQNEIHIPINKMMHTHNMYVVFDSSICSDPRQYLLIMIVWPKGNLVFIHIIISIYTRKYNSKLQPTMIGYLCSVGGHLGWAPLLSNP